MKMTKYILRVTDDGLLNERDTRKHTHFLFLSYPMSFRYMRNNYSIDYIRYSRSVELMDIDHRRNKNIVSFFL